MLAQAGEPFDSDKHLFEIKWDGVRCLAFVEAGSLRLQNRRFVEMLGRYPEFACLDRLPPGTVLDSELIVLDRGKPSFDRLAQREHIVSPARIQMLSQRMPAMMMAFDLLYLRGRCLTERPLVERRRRLADLIAELNEPRVLVPDHLVGDGIHYFNAAEEAGLEGIMAKALASPYLPGQRSPHWIKIKVATTGEFEIIGFTPGTNKGTIGALIVGMQYRGKLIFKGKVGSGFTEPQRRSFFKDLEKRDPLPNPPADGPKDAVWRLTGQSCRVRYFEKTVVGKLRGPVFDGLVKKQHEPKRTREARDPSSLQDSP
jgi:ATP-dependent DNA ligase